MQPIFRYFRRKRMVLNGKIKLMPVAEKPLIILIFPDFTEGVGRNIPHLLGKRALISNFFRISLISEISGSHLPVLDDTFRP
jgi:hypothetical protein